MKINNKGAVLLAMTLALASVGFVPTADAAGKYKDVTSDAWFAPALDSFSSVGLISGYPDGTFQPDKTVSRAEFLTILYNIVEKPSVEGVNSGFSDVNGTWYEKQVKYAVQSKLLDNTEWKDTFQADQPVTRGEAAVLIWNLVGDDSFRNIRPDKNLFPNYFVGGASIKVPFSDYGEAPRFVRYSVLELYAHDVVHGFPDNTYRYNQTVTRAEATLMLQTALKKVEYPKIVPPVLYNVTSNPNNLVDLGDGTYSFGNIQLDKYTRSDRTEEQVIKDIREFLKLRVIINGDKVTVKAPDTGTDNLWWGIGTYHGRGPYEVTFTSELPHYVYLVDHVHAQHLVDVDLVYRDGVWKAEY